MEGGHSNTYWNKITVQISNQKRIHKDGQKNGLAVILPGANFLAQISGAKIELQFVHS